MCKRNPFKTCYPEILIFLSILLFYVSNSLFIGRQLTNFATEVFSATACSFGLGMFDEPVRRYALFDIHFDPPLYSISASLVTLLCGRNWMVMNLVNNTFYLLMLFVGMYLLGREVRDRKTGILAVLLVSLYPPVYGAFRLFCYDFPLMGLMAVSIYVLLKSECFRRRKWSIVLGIACGWGLMTKDAYGAFMAGPLLYSFAIACREACRKNYAYVANLLLFAVVVMVLASPYYYSYVTNQRFIGLVMSEPLDNKWYEFSNLKLFTTGLWEEQLTPLFFVVFLAGLGAFMKQAGRRVQLIVFLWVVIPNIILVLMPHWKHVKHLIPQMPAFALVSAVGLSVFSKKWYGKAVIPVIATLGFLQFFDITYGTRLNILEHGVWNRVFRSAPYFRSSCLNQSLSEMKQESAVFDGIREVFESKIRESGKKGRLEVVVMPSKFFFGDMWLGEYFWFNRMPVKQISMWQDSVNIVDEVHGRMGEIDYLFRLSRKNEDAALHFDIIKRNLLAWKHALARDADVLGDSPIEEYERKWNTVRERFGRHEAFPLDGGLVVNLYSK